jgi:FixJ family two-component response regulator
VRWNQVKVRRGLLARTSIRILIVDDSEPWRQQVRSILEVRPDLHIVAEASDGFEAVRKAKELDPDLVVLEVSLSDLDGFGAASRIRQALPSAAIIILTKNSDENSVRAAFRIGARGYVLKTDAGNELLNAVARILDGDDFVSTGVPHRIPTRNRKQVAVVDDDRSIQSALRDLIESEGLSAICFGSAEEFVDSDARHKAACVIADVRMPGMSGLELQARLRLERCRIPIIFISAHGDAEMRIRAMREGAVEFLIKPFSDAVLLRTVRAVLEQ